MTEESHFETFPDATCIPISTESDLPQYFTNNNHKSIVSYVEEKLKQTNKIELVTFRGETQLEGDIDDESSNTSTNNHTNSYNRKLKIRFSHFSTEQWNVLFILCYVYFSAYTSEDMLSTFFGTEILRKGGSKFHVGLIFGIYPISKCLLCPLFTYLLKQISCKTMLLGGFATFSMSTLALSQTGRLMSWDTFLILCVILRILQAIGNSATFVASVFLVSRQWKSELIFAFGAAETFTGVAMIIGPLVGGWLYQEGGFELPFYWSFIINVIGLFLCYYKLQPSANKTSPENFLHLLRTPNVMVTAVFLCFIVASDDLVNSVLQVYMTTKLNSSPVTIGIMFVISASSYLLTVGLIGLFAQTRFAERLTMICGGLLIAIGYLLIGPSEIFSSLGWTNPTVLSVSISMLIMGVGLGAGLVSNYNDISRSVINHGMEDNETTDSLVGALFNSATFLGEFLGPILGGSMMEGMGNFQTVSSTFAAIIAFVVIITAICYLVDGRKSPHEH